MFWIFLFGFTQLFSYLVLEDLKDNFVLETRKIVLEKYPQAFNPSIIQWKGKYLLSFRVIEDPDHSFNSELGLVWLNESFKPIGTPQLIEIRDFGSSVPARGEDARLITEGDKLYFIYSDCDDPLISRGGFRVFISQVDENEGVFTLKKQEKLIYFEGEDPSVREKNWVPFIYQNELYLAYSIVPHIIFKPLFGTNSCETFCKSKSYLHWDWGEIRGGTPAHLVRGEYLAFFHSSKYLVSDLSYNKSIAHYFMGAYTYEKEPPFRLTSISSKPIVGKNFYKGPLYKPYWKPIRCVFPCGYVHDDQYIWVAYGRQDHEMWLAKIEIDGLLNSLIPVDSK